MVYKRSCLDYRERNTNYIKMGGKIRKALLGLFTNKTCSSRLCRKSLKFESTGIFWL